MLSFADQRPDAALRSPVHADERGLLKARHEPARRFGLANITTAFFQFLLLSCMGPSVLATAQSSQLVEGRVTDDRGIGIERAEVTLRNPRLQVFRYADVTDSDGQFSFANVVEGEYLLEVRHLAFRRADSLIVVGIDGPRANKLKFVLPVRSVPVAEVLITDSRSIIGTTPVAMTNLSRREIERSSDMKDIPVVLSTTPSVTHYSENGNGLGYTYLRMRGFDQKRIAVSINGIPQNDPEAFDVFWINFFDLQGSVQDIQVQRGAGSSVYGSTGIGGAINIVALPFGPGPFAEVNAGLGSYDTRRLSVSAGSGLLADRWTLYGRLSKLDSNGYRDWSWTDYLRYFVAARRVGNRSVVSFISYGGRQKDALAYIGIPKAANDGSVDDGFGTRLDRRSNYSEFTRDVERFNQPHFELHHSLQLNRTTNFDQSLFYVTGNGYFDFDGTFRSANYLRLPVGSVVDSLRSEPLFVSRPGASLLYRAAIEQWQVGWIPRFTRTTAEQRSTVGGEFRVHRSTRWGRIQESTWLPQSIVGDSDYRSYSVSGEKLIGLLYARTERAIASGFTVLGETSLSYSRYRVFDESFFGTEFSKPYAFVNPRVGITYTPRTGVSLFASLSYSSREPRLKALYDGEEAGAGSRPQFDADANGSIDLDKPFVKPEHVVDLEIGSTLRVERLRAGATLFVMNFRDEIVSSGGLDQFGIPRTGNASRTRHAGIEMEAEYRIGRFADVFASVTVSRNRFIEFDEYLFGSDAAEKISRDNNPIAGFPDHVANVGATLQGRGFQGSVSSAYVGKQFVDNAGTLIGDNGNVVPPHVLVNVNLRYAFSGKMNGLQLSLDVNNVLDSEVLQFGNVGFGTPQFFPAATRNVFFGVRYRLES